MSTNENSNRYALHALRERRAHIAGELLTLERRIRHLRESLVHIDATLRLFDRDAQPETIKPKQFKRVKLFGPGKLNMMVRDALRRGGRPMTTKEVIEAVVVALDFSPDAAKGMAQRVRANLGYLAKHHGSVVKTGSRETAVWALQDVP